MKESQLKELQSANPEAVYVATSIDGVYLCIDARIYGTNEVILCVAGEVDSQEYKSKIPFISIQLELGIIRPSTRKQSTLADLAYYRFAKPRGLFVKPLLT